MHSTSLTTAILRLEHDLRLAREAAMRTQRLTVPQYDALVAIAGGTTASGADVARSLGLTSQTGHTILSNLERRGFIERAMVRGEGRAKVITLTKAGAAALRKATRASAAVEQKLAASLPGGGAGQLAALLAEARSAFAAQDGSQNPAAS